MSTTTQGQTEHVSERVWQELNDAYKAHGIPGVTECVTRSLNEWQNIPLNIAVTGSSGTGKSSFINAILGLAADDEGAAEVGVTETTSVPTPYLHPDNKSLKLWDLPGVGTPTFSRDTYLQKVDFDRFDFFLIFTCSRFTNLDLWLAKQVASLQKRFYFIRTKVDVDLSNDLRAHPKTHNRTAVLDLIRDNTAKQLQDADFHDSRIFLINNFELRELDFERLSMSLIRDSPELKREAFALSLTNLSEEIIREKSNYLRRRIYVVSIASAAAAAVPIPGVGTAVDIGILLEEAMFYRKQLRLDDRSIQDNASALKVTVDEMKSSLNLQSRIITFTARGLLTFFSSLGLSNLSENVLRIAIPLIGSVLAAGLSYGTQVFCLKSLLGTLVEDALIINRRLTMAVANTAFEEQETLQEVKK